VTLQVGTVKVQFTIVLRFTVLGHLHYEVVLK